MDLGNAWRVHTPNLLKEIANNSGNAILARPLQIFGEILYQVGERASQLNDPALNALMLRLTIYEEADPESRNYKPELMKKVLNSH